MVEMFGSRCARLTIVKLRHCGDGERLLRLDAIDGALRSIAERAMACD